MENEKRDYSSIDEYIGSFPPDIQEKLEEVRAAVKAAAPGAEEKISYRMPAFTLNGNLVYFAAFKKHIGFYPIPSGVDTFKEELKGYKYAKGSVQFPLDKPMPLELIKRIVEFRAEENLRKAAVKK